MSSSNMGGKKKEWREGGRKGRLMSESVLNQLPQACVRHRAGALERVPSSALTRALKCVSCSALSQMKRQMLTQAGYFVHDHHWGFQRWGLNPDLSGFKA